MVVGELVHEGGHFFGGAGESVEEVRRLVGFEVVGKHLGRQHEAVEAPLDVVAEAAKGRVVLIVLGSHGEGQSNMKCRFAKR